MVIMALLLFYAIPSNGERFNLRTKTSAGNGAIFVSDDDRTFIVATFITDWRSPKRTITRLLVHEDLVGVYAIKQRVSSIGIRCHSYQSGNEHQQKKGKG